MAGGFKVLGRRKNDERGTAMVVIAISAVMVVGAAGLGVDTANVSFRQGNAQRGVDAAALAIANDCALDLTDCSPSSNHLAAEYFVDQNAPGATVDTPVVPAGGGTVTVKASHDVPTSLMKVLGIDSATVRADATAVWGGHPVVGDPVLPLAIPYCMWEENQPGTSSTPIVLRTDLVGRVTDTLSTLGLVSTVQQTVTNWLLPVSQSCTTPDGEDVAMLRGPVWLSGVTEVLSGVLNWIPSECKMHVDDVNAFVGGTLSSTVEPSCIAKLGTTIKSGTTVLLPIYKPANHLIDLGFELSSCTILLQVNACVTVPPRLGVDIIGYAPFKVTGWNFFGNTHTDPSAPPCSSLSLLGINLGLVTIPGVSVGCTGLTGTFVRSAVSDPNFTYTPDGADFGATEVRLVE